MKLKIALTLTLGALALFWIPSVTATTPEVEAQESAALPATAFETVLLETAGPEAPGAPSCSTGLIFGEGPAFRLFGFDPGCDPPACNKSCIIQGYDFGTCSSNGCNCRYYV